MFGEVVAAAYALSNGIATDRAIVADLAVRHVERVLAHGRNARLVAALKELDRLLLLNQGVSATRRSLGAT
jgi:hypothetical protein